VEDRPPLTLRDALLNHWLLVLAIVFTFLAGAGFLSVQSPVYAATALIYLDVSRTAPGFDEGAQAGELMQHDLIVLSTSRSVLQEACAAPDVRCTDDERAAPETLAGRIAVTADRGTSTLGVTAQAPTATEAAALANAVAQAMLEQDKAEVVRLFKPARDDLQVQLANLGAAMDKEQKQLRASFPGSSAAAAHEAQLTSLQLQYSAVFGRLQDLAEQQDRLTTAATISQSALPPVSPQSPNRLRYLLAALVAGLVVGVLAALLAQRFDDRIHDGEALARATNTPLALAVRPARRRSPGLQPYSLALGRVLAGSPRAQTVLVTAASARDNSAAVAIGLGEAALDAGQRVVVVHSNGHSPAPPQLTEGDGPGMTSIAAASSSHADIDAALASASAHSNGDSARTCILVAVPSPETSPAAMVLGRTAKRAVLTATAGVTRFQDARRTADLLRLSGVDVVAAILLTRRAADKVG
jgi:capsular polysaccharide biosynthesis protein